MDLLLSEEDDLDADAEQQEVNYEDELKIKFKHLKQGIPGARLKHVKLALAKVDCIDQLDLPFDFLGEISGKITKKYYQRVMAELPSSMKEHKPTTRYATFTLFCYYRSQVLIDELADLLIRLIHQIGHNAEKHIDKKILSEVKRVNGKSLQPPNERTPLIGHKKNPNQPIASDYPIRLLIQSYFDAASEELAKLGDELESNNLKSATVHWLRHTGISDDVKHRPREHVHDDAGLSSSAITDSYIDVELKERAKSAKEKIISQDNM